MKINLKFNKYIKLVYYLFLTVIISIFIAVLMDGYLYNKIFMAYINNLNPYSKSALSSKRLEPSNINYYNPILKDNVFNADINGSLVNYNPNATFLSLNVKLIGTIKGNINYAFFLNGVKEIFVKEGGRINGGFTLYKVSYKSVLVSKNGETLKVHLIKGQLAINSYSAGGTPLAPNALSLQNGLNNTLNLGRAIKKVGMYSYDIDRSMIKKNELNSVFTQMHAVPDIVNNKIVGFKVINVMQGGVFSYMGFKPGDVIKSVNGTALNSPQEAINLLSGIMYQNNVNVNLIRGNQKLTLSYSIQ